MNKLIRYVPGVVGALLFCLCIPVMAQNPSAVCQAEIARAKALTPASSAVATIDFDVETYRSQLSDCSASAVEYAKSSIAAEQERISNWDRKEQDRISRFELRLCFSRAHLNRCNASDNSQNRSNNSNNAVRPAESLRQESDPRNSQLQRERESATQLAEQRQKAVDQARQGKPKRHVVAREAHNCLKPQTGGGVINNCPYAVEYSYCVLRPEPNTWSELFTCGKNIGSWQIGPGPNTRAIMHTAGQATYWFACRYGDTLSKPDGVSPVDLEFQAGRGLTGRCAEWGGGGAAASASQANAAPPAEPARQAVQQMVPPAQPAFTPGVCTRADKQTSKRIQLYAGGPLEYCACIPGYSYEATRCRCLERPGALGC